MLDEGKIAFFAFPYRSIRKNLGRFSKGHGKTFHQNVKEMMCGYGI